MRRSFQQLLAASCLATGFSAVLVVPALAQTAASPSAGSGAHSDAAAPELEEVIVTAQLREEKLEDMPMSVATVSGEALQSQHITDIADLSYLIPNLDVARIGPSEQIIAIRGMSGERGSSSLTGIYLDDIPVNGLQDGFLATYPDVGMYDLQRVEVLKGPQGTLFGEGAVGGVVRFLTNRPDLTAFGGSVSVTGFGTAGGAPSEEMIAVVNVPIITDEFAIRLATDLQNNGGWIDQPTTGRTDINYSSAANVRATALWMPTDALSVSGLVAIHRGEAGASDIVNSGPPDNSNFIQGYNLYAPTNLWDDFQMYNLSVTYDLGFAKLLSSTSNVERNTMQNLTQAWAGDTAVSPFNAVYVPDYTQHVLTTSEELRLTSSGQGPLKWLVGVEYKDTALAFDYPSEDVSLFNGAFRSAVPVGPTTDTSKSATAYGDVSYEIASRVEIGGGLRYFDDDRAAFVPGVTDSRESARFNNLTYRYYGSYAFTPDVKLYATVGTGFRSGGFNLPLFVSEGAPESYGPENDTTYEAGLKSTLFERRISFDAAAFYSLYRHLQDDTIAMGNASTGGNPIQFTTNGQSADLKGVEWNVAWAASTHLTLSLAGDVIETDITKTLPGNSYNVGDPISFVPRYSVAVAADDTFNWTSDIRGFVHVDVDRKGASFDTLNGLLVYDTPRQTSVPGVTFVNLNLGAKRDNWSLTFFGRNLSDERGFIRASAFGETTQARPLSYGVTIERSF